MRILMVYVTEIISDDQINILKYLEPVTLILNANVVILANIGLEVLGTKSRNLTTFKTPVNYIFFSAAIFQIH